MISLSDVSDESPREELLQLVAGLRSKLVASAPIEQAKGAIMLTYGLTADAAFALLRHASQSWNVKLRTIATELASRLSDIPTSSAAMTAFDRLLAEVADHRPEARPTAAPPPAPFAGSGAAGDPGGDRPTPLPSVTIAENVADLPLVYANRAFGELTGYQVGDVLGRNCRFLQGPGTDPAKVAALGRALAAGRDVSVVLRNYRVDGSTFLNRVSISPLVDTANQITHFVGTQIEVAARPEAPFRGPTPDRPTR